MANEQELSNFSNEPNPSDEVPNNTFDEPNNAFDELSVENSRLLAPETPRNHYRPPLCTDDDCPVICMLRGMMVLSVLMVHYFVLYTIFSFYDPHLELDSFSVSKLNISELGFEANFQTDFLVWSPKRDALITYWNNKNRQRVRYDVFGLIYYRNVKNLVANGSVAPFFLVINGERKKFRVNFASSGSENNNSDVDNVFDGMDKRALRHGVTHLSMRIDLWTSFVNSSSYEVRSFDFCERRCWDLMLGLKPGKLIMSKLRPCYEEP